jgi:hypothetical protein
MKDAQVFHAGSVAQLRSLVVRRFSTWRAVSAAWCAMLAAWCAVLSRGAACPSRGAGFSVVVRCFLTWCGVFLRGAGFFGGFS